jgi:hypothetical protein
MSLLTRSNDALGVNPPVGNRHLTTHGSDWLWAVCAIYTFSFLVVIGLTFVARQGERIFHYLFTISLFTGAIAYFAMASDLGAVAIHISDNLSSAGFREIFYARYINWYASLSSSSCITSGCQNSWRKAAFQCTIIDGTFVKRRATCSQIVPQIGEHSKKQNRS